MADMQNVYVHNCSKLYIVAEKSNFGSKTVWYKIRADDLDIATVFHPQSTDGVWPLVVLPERPGEEEKSDG